LKNFQNSLENKKYPLKPKGMDKQAEKMKSEIDAKKAKI